jgi:phytanoyl-CoA hydroxylase
VSTTAALTPDQRETWHEQGFVRLTGFADPSHGDDMLQRVTELVRSAAGGADVGRALVLAEGQPDLRAWSPEERASKVFRLCREEVFRSFVVRQELTSVVAELIDSDDLDCFLSQFIFKNRGAWGQPWHQDSVYFRFEPPRPVVAVWLAVTPATLDNGCLHVLAGSHREPVHEHVPDRRPGANYGYIEIVDHDMTGSQPITMLPGDVLLFDSHLMHRSTDNVSDSLRAAMVYHVAAAGTVDRTHEVLGLSTHDWIPIRRRASLGSQD